MQIFDIIKNESNKSKVGKKGDIEFIQSYLYIIIALLIGGLMIFLLLRYYPSNGKAPIRGNVAKELAKYALECWEENRYGMEPTPNVCRILNVTNITSEKEITKYLDCEKLPNNICIFDNCENCTSKSFDDNDRLEVFLEYSGEVKIAYLDRKILIASLSCDSTCVCKRNCKSEATKIVKECLKNKSMSRCLIDIKEEYEKCINKKC